MTRRRATQLRDKLRAKLSAFELDQLLRGSLLERTVFHSSGCLKCARGEGHPLWVLNVNYLGGNNRQISLHPDQVPHVRQWLENHRQLKEMVEAICNLNQQLLRLDRAEARSKERQP